MVWKRTKANRVTTTDSRIDMHAPQYEFIEELPATEKAGSVPNMSKFLNRPLSFVAIFALVIILFYLINCGCKFYFYFNLNLNK